MKWNFRSAPKIMQQFILLFAFKRQNKLRDANLIGYLELLPLLPRPTIKHLIPGATLPIHGFIMLEILLRWQHVKFAVLGALSRHLRRKLSLKIFILIARGAWNISEYFNVCQSFGKWNVQQRERERKYRKERDKVETARSLELLLLFGGKFRHLWLSRRAKQCR